jgi:hypothetical protein
MTLNRKQRRAARAMGKIVEDRNVYEIEYPAGVFTVTEKGKLTGLGIPFDAEYRLWTNRHLRKDPAP